MKRTALVTGASAGLGLEFARQFASRGHDLVLVARREERLKEVASELSQRHGVDAAFLAADLADRNAPASIEAFLRDRGIEVDWLVNNAGSAGPHLLEDRDWSEQAAFFELMMLSVAQMCHRFVPAMRERGFGRAAGLQEMKRGMPSFIWYDAATVVREGIEAVDAGKPIWVSGRLYRWLDPFAQSVWIRPLLKRFSPGR